MKEPKFTQGPWEVIENSWSDTTLVSGDVEIATKSIYHEATEETQEELEDIVSANFNLISQAPELFKLLQETISCLDKYCIPETSDELTSLVSRSKEVIKKSLGE